jgi:hypothetical protein
VYSELYLGSYQEREGISKCVLVTLSVVRISRSDLRLCQRNRKQTFSSLTEMISSRKVFWENGKLPHAYFLEITKYDKVYTFFKPHESSRLPKIGGEPFGCLGSFIIGRTRPLPHRDVVKIGALGSKRDLQCVHSRRSYNCNWKRVK